MKHIFVSLILSMMMATPVFANEGDVSIPTVPAEYQGSYYCAAISNNCGIDWETQNWKGGTALLILARDRIMINDGSQYKFENIIKRYDADVKVNRLILVQSNDRAYVFTKVPDNKVAYCLVQIYSISTDLEVIRFMLVRK